MEKNLVNQNIFTNFVVSNLLQIWLNITFNLKKEKMARYQTLLSEETKDRLHDDILRMLVSEQKYKDPAYNSRRLAEDFGEQIPATFLLFVQQDSTRTILNL